MSWIDDDDRDYSDIQSEYEADLIDKGIAELPVENIRAYLAQNGDAIQVRVNRCIDESDSLLAAGHFGAALVVAVTATEIIIRFFVLRPLVQGAFLSDQLAGLLVKRIVSGSSSKDRELLPKISSHWGIDLENLALMNGKKLWPTLTKDIWPLRNAYVHRADVISREQAALALECTRALLADLVKPIAIKFNLSWPQSGVWHRTQQGVNGATTTADYTKSDPFLA